MKIEKNKVVALTYELHSSTQELKDRAHVETTDHNNPLVFLFGAGNMIPDFEKNLEGKSPGDTFEFSIKANNAYGESDPAAIVSLPLDIFKVDGIVDLNLLQTGKIIPLSDDEGNQMNAKVLKIEAETVLMDFNHQLAGHDLHFKGKIAEVRDATPDEISHGHVHTGHEGH
jgi:FKBP-type peptidyl-prolyl cis-trans isomerase SlyD